MTNPVYEIEKNKSKSHLFHTPSDIVEHIDLMIDNKFVVLHTEFGIGSSLSH